jgi:hypothetical protein
MIVCNKKKFINLQKELAPLTTTPLTTTTAGRIGPPTMREEVQMEAQQTAESI